ncbi:hypothetical protein FSOLCH5_004848 [Fusarium solani]
MTFGGFHAWDLSRGQQDFNFNSPIQNNPFRSNDELCNECSLLDLEAAFDRAHDLYEQARRGHNTRKLVTCRGPNGPTYLRDFYFVTSFGRRLSEERLCKLCSFFRQHAQEPAKGTYKLLAICSSETSLFEPPRKNARGRRVRRPWGDMEYNILLAVVPELHGVPRTGVPLRWLETELPKKGSIYRLTQDVEGEDGRRLILPERLDPKADMEIVGYWQYTCGASHGSHCSPKKPPGATLRGFRAINCNKRPMSPEPVSWSEKYAALSYVWGPGEEKWPQTIKDAMTVTRMMGLKYLWVDRLCIDQNNLEEKMFLISKMNAIYEGAEVTIINAAGDARTGLPGVGNTPRTPQPTVHLDLFRGKTAASRPTDVYLDLLNVRQVDYDAETQGHSMWMDTYRHGLNQHMEIPLDEMMGLSSRTDEYGIPKDHLEFHESNAEHFGIPFDEYMEKQLELARRIGIPFTELVPWLMRKTARKKGIPDDQPLPSKVPGETMTDSSKPVTPLPPGKVPEKTVLVSTMQDPRVAIRNSQWATRGWTYQEGVLSRRCLVFTKEQIYWECRGMAVNETIRLPLPALHAPAETGRSWLFADYMLSGIFRGDMHATPELQFGFRSEEDDDGRSQIKALDGHIRSFTARNLTNPSDSLNAFLGISARYSKNADNGLSLLLGIPIWAGAFADGQPGLQHSFAMSVSAWFHTGSPVEPGSELYVSGCPRRSQFPSWTWIGWQGRADFNGDNTDPGVEGDDEDSRGDNAHIDFFAAMTSPDWVRSVSHIWSAEMMLHSEDGRFSTLLEGFLPLQDFNDSTKIWLLTVKRPLVLKHLHMMPSKYSEEWMRLMGRRVELHMSETVTEEELRKGHQSGTMVTVLVFAATVPFVWDGRARFLVLRRVDAAGTRWERIGSLVLTMEEHLMDKYSDSESMVRDLPVQAYSNDLVVV